MGYSKRIALEDRERESMQDMDQFFNPEYLTIDVRVGMQISIDVLDRIVDHKLLKKDIRRKMRSQFNKELTRQLKNKL